MSDGVNMTVAGDISKPASLLIHKISRAIGVVYEPIHIRRLAAAQSDATLIEAKTQIEVTELQRRALIRLAEEEAKRQQNIEQITEKATSLLDETSCPDKVEDDWITNFFAHSRTISDDDMQNLWARILARESNEPRSFSRKTINVISDLGRQDAELFSRMCGFVWTVISADPIVFDYNDPIYQNAGITFDSIRHLEAIGLVQTTEVAQFVRQRLPKHHVVSYQRRRVRLTHHLENGNSLSMGSVLFTSAGRELYRVCNSTAVNGFFEYVFKRWSNEALQPVILDEPAQS